MCMANLPIVFDEAGKAWLEEAGSFAVSPSQLLVGAAAGAATNGSAPSRNGRSSGGAPATNGRTTEFNIDPVTRIAGALAFHTRLDHESGVITEAYSEAVQFRGYELILKGRNPLDAIDISSRACGVCGGVHSTCSAMALEMTFGVAPAPLAIAARNLAAGAEFMYDHCLHLFLLAGPDYSEAMVRRTSPSLWARAQRTAAPRCAVHGLSTVGEIMTGLNPLSGALYREALAATRSGREIVSLILGKYPHPSTILPGGLGTRLDQSLLNQVLARILALRDYVKRVVAIWEDLVEFFYEALPRYEEVGARQANLVTTGVWDDPESYDADYLNADRWGRRRLSTPGAVIDGELRTTSLNNVNLGIEEFVEHSFYESWTDDSSVAAPAPDGSPISPYHPWSKETVPRPESRSWKERYSWSTAPRWDRQPMESGPLARQWVTAAAGHVNTEFVRSGDGKLDILIPEGDLPETVIEWRVPEVVNALERNRARAIQVAYSLATCYSSLLQALDYVREGETAMSAPFEVTDGVGVGYWEGGRGILTHHCKVQDGRLANYQIVTPSTWMASPRDPWGVPGPYEEAVVNTPLLEETRGTDEFAGIDILRAIRSFDPCLPCTVHMHSGAGTIVSDATTCACGQE